MRQPPKKMGGSSGSATANYKPGSTPEGKPKVKKEKAVKTSTKDCAILFVYFSSLHFIFITNCRRFGDSGPVVASSPSFGLGSKMGARLGLVVPAVGQSFFGAQLLIPRDPGQEMSEATGRGVCHICE